MQAGRVVFVDAEREALEDLFQHATHEIVRQREGRVSLLEGCRLEETAVEIRNRTERVCVVAAFVPCRVETTEKQRQQDRREKAAIAGRCGVEAVDEKASFAVEPALFLNEIEEKDSRQKEQCFGVARIAGLAGAAVAQESGDLAHRVAKADEELARQRFPIEGAIENPWQLAARTATEREEIEPIDGARPGVCEIELEPA